MAYGQQTAFRAQTTVINIAATDSWVALQGATALTNRFATKVHFMGKASDRLRLIYDRIANIENASDELGSGNTIVEPNCTGLTFYGRLKGGSGDRAKIVVTEYGH